MERQAIERLAMDAALGELNDDAATLFEAYLTEHPEARQWARPMKAICERTREAVAARTASAALPPRRAAPPARRISRARLANAGRWAAVVIVSLALGAAAGRRGKPPTESISHVAASAETGRGPARRDWRAVLNGRGEGFWEAKAVATRQRHPGGGSYEPRPSPWEMLKQRQEERKDAL
jgi:anti-sigma factor RsiW